MCGITGHYSFNTSPIGLDQCLTKAVSQLGKRGPDNAAQWSEQNIGLGHARLSILDTSELGHQPMIDSSERYVLAFNGEIYNYLELKKSLTGITFKSSTDTEVLLYLLIHKGAECLSKLNGFFSIAFYDREEKILLLARDRMGIKPLHYFQSEDFLAFGSEMKALFTYPKSLDLDQEALYWYLKLNYLPGTKSMINGVNKLEPGHYLKISTSEVQKEQFSSIHSQVEYDKDYAASQTDLVNLLEASVQKRLMSDVPLGSFLSGGTDSSAIVALASRHHKNLSTFSIGYHDNPFFDETYYAELVAEKFRTNHTTFKLTNDDLLNDLDDILDYIDEPFADSSAIPTYILSKHVKKHVTVALSGDGADELFGGYYKHQALAKALNPGFKDTLVKHSNSLFSALPKSRSSTLGNLVRRLDKFGKLQKLSPSERYWFLASLTNDPSFYLLSTQDQSSLKSFKDQFLNDESGMNDYLLADQEIVLPGDMLTKVDLMSMSNSLEVRVPFIDKSVVDFANSLPVDYKVTGQSRKRIVQDAFRQILPSQIYQRPKKGFEVPLLQWMRKELLDSLDEFVFDRERLSTQGIFQTEKVMGLRKVLLSDNPGDVHGILWALMVFQKWHHRYLA